MQNDLRLRSWEMRKYQESLKILWNDRLVPNQPAKTKILLILAKALEKQKSNISRSAISHIKARVSFKYFLNVCSSLEE